jgi:hypothetical protein
MPRATRNSVVFAITAPPSSFTICAPAAIMRAQFLKAAAGVPWKLPNGMSAMTSARCDPLATQFTWYSVASTVTESVSSRPWITMPRESPMRSMSTPASSESFAKLAS